ncbi:conserved hypothetical protein [Neospora caninum Liverpool]|uniref:Uncharacterized protein n=1 Tax=Neospora caninum (strain Liverpool) TaxID=572307 RepID=F0VL23_NEOCL|nr:conserved hypothetical protein [Neospora caninum Liverpool]CBZ54775.1 conserved hypothetical protein [Neospora caninum Liverpool]CEL69492.1 TPA: hypothetical protein BN1204_052010 [Neospora caninum Liverpool]|eukprot:XP_003884803.1 conserved hypothetical protein [Neospora caninum Liverpool]
MEAGEVLVLSRRELVPCSSSSSLASGSCLPPSRERKEGKVSSPRAVEKKKKRREARGDSQTCPAECTESAAASEPVDSTDRGTGGSPSSQKTVSGCRISSKRAARGRGRGQGVCEEERPAQGVSSEPAPGPAPCCRGETGNEGGPGRTRGAKGEEEGETQLVPGVQSAPQRTADDLGGHKANRGASQNRRRKEERRGEEALDFSSVPVDKGERTARSSGAVLAPSHVSASAASSQKRASRGCLSSCHPASSRDAFASTVVYASAGEVDRGAGCRAPSEVLAPEEGTKEGKARTRTGKRESQGVVKRNVVSDREDRKDRKEDKAGGAVREKLSRSSSSSSLATSKERMEQEENNTGGEPMESESHAGGAEPKEGADEQERRGKEKQGKAKKRAAKKEGIPPGIFGGTGRSRKGEKSKPGEEREDKEAGKRENTVLTICDEKAKDGSVGEKQKTLSSSLSPVEGDTTQGEKRKKNRKKSECATPPLHPAQPSKPGMGKTQTASREAKNKRNERRSTEGVSSLSPSFSPAFGPLSTARSSRSLPCSSSSGRGEQGEGVGAASYEPPSVSGCVPTRHSEPRAGMSLSALGYIRFGGLSSALSASTSFLLQSLVQRQEAARHMKAVEGGPSAQAAASAVSSAGVSAGCGRLSGVQKEGGCSEESKERQQSGERDEATQGTRPAGSSDLEEKTEKQEKGAKTLFFSRRDGTLDSFFSLLGSMSSPSASATPATASSSRPSSALSSSSSSLSTAPPLDPRRERESPGLPEGGEQDAAPVSPTSFLLGLLTRRSSGRGASAETVGGKGTARKGQAEAAALDARPLLSLLRAPESRGRGIETQETCVRGREGKDAVGLPAFKSPSPILTHASRDSAEVNSAVESEEALTGSSASPALTAQSRELPNSSSRKAVQLLKSGPGVSPAVPYAASQSPSLAALMAGGGLLSAPSAHNFPLGRTKSAPSGNVSAAASAALFLPVRPETSSPGAPPDHVGCGRRETEQRGNAYESQRAAHSRETRRLSFARGIPSSPSSASSRSSSVFVVGSRGSFGRGDMSRRILPASLGAKATGNGGGHGANKEKRRAGMRRSASVETVTETETRERAARRKEGRLVEKMSVQREAGKPGSREFAAPSFMAIPFPHEVPPPPFLRM